MRIPSKLSAPALFAACALAPCAGASPAGPSASGASGAPVRLAYRLNPGESVRYKLSADIHGTIPLLDPTASQEMQASLSLIFVVTPKTRLADGTMDVAFTVEKPELEIEKIPLPLTDEQVQQVLDQTVTLASTGEVIRVAGGAPLPGGLSIPGVDPKRLYAVIFPVVFQARPVRTGDSWRYKSELLGGDGASPTFTATLLAPNSPHDAAGPSAGAGDRSATSLLRADFVMPVDVKVDADHKRVTEGAQAHRARHGKIDGSGVFTFDRTAGRMTHGDVDIHANVRDTLVGKPTAEDEPKELISRITARVRLDLLPPGAGDETKPAAPAAGSGNQEGKP